MLRAIAFALLVLGGCSGSAAPAPAAPESTGPVSSSAAPTESGVVPAPTAAAAAGPRLELTLAVRPKAVMTAAESADFRLELEVKNPGTTPVRPNLVESTLFVNDKPFKRWNEALAAHPKTEPWEELPPGKIVTFSFVFQRHQPIKAGHYKFYVVAGPNKSDVVEMDVQ